MYLVIKSGIRPEGFLGLTGKRGTQSSAACSGTGARSPRWHRSLLPALLALCLLLTVHGAALAQDVRSLLGNGGGPAQTIRLQALRDSGGKSARLGSDRAANFWNGSAPTPQNFDQQVRDCYQFDLIPVMNLIQYTTWEPNMGSYDKWYAIGRAFAERFQPNSQWLRSQGISNWGVERYVCLNEVWNTHFYNRPLTPLEHRDIIKGFADGVHSINPNFKVTTGGWTAGVYKDPPTSGSNPLFREIVPLLKNGTLYAFNLHQYWWGNHIPMTGHYENSAQYHFDQTKAAWGLPDSVKFVSTEWNVNKHSTLPDYAPMYLSALWDLVGVTNSANGPATDFAKCFVVCLTTAEFNEPDHDLALCTDISPWTPEVRGQIFRRVCNLTDGMQFISMNPRGTGEYVLNGNNKKLWVWQNRTAWTNHPGTSFTVTGIPTSATRLEVHDYNGLRRTITLSGQTSYTVTGLPTNQTLMFLANASSGGTGQLDLIVTDVTWTPASPVTGNAITFSAVIKNQGTAATPASTIHGVAFSVNGTRVSFSDQSTSSLAAEATRTVTANGGTWTPTSAGSYSVEAFVDDIDRIPNESNENNNKHTETLTVGSSVAKAINSGGAAASPFLADTGFSGGSAASTTATIDTSGVTNPAPQAVYQNCRWFNGMLTYTVTGLTADASHTVRLHWAELTFNAANQRKFHVNVNGTRVLTDFDVRATAGALNKAVVREFTAAANGSGQITVTFSKGAIENPFISGIEVRR